MRTAGFFLALILGFTSCNTGDDIRFHRLTPDQTGITFSNDIRTDAEFNALFYEYLYNGGGVAAGDVNGDGWVDLFFTGNQVTSRLYLNRGELKFEDVTERTGVTTDRWCTGVAMADVNDDGRLDIYVSVAGYQTPAARMANLLFINQGNDENGVPVFEEQARAYGVADTGYSTQAAFFDYDIDGDLDLYLLTNALEKEERNSLRPKRVNGEAASTDRLYRNNGNGTFTNVSREAGILIEGYGLGVTVSDLNLDGYPDVYAANDFLSNDLIWINNGDGTFTDRAADYLKHQTHNGMGVDIADINNDQLPDIAVLDMLPPDNYRQKMMMPYVNRDKFDLKQAFGYQDQYMRNTLQLHRGVDAGGGARFSEIGFLAGIAATDWSWAALFADYDNDGWKDLYITNGYRKDVTNLDYINYSNYNAMFGTLEAKVQKAVDDLEETPDVPLPNYLFRNKGDLTFENVAARWGLEEPSFSNGAVYADLDRDGDLDLVTNNIDQPALVYENRLNELESGHHNYLRVRLTENSPQVTHLNARVLLYTGGHSQYQECTPYRGYKSSVEDVLHFGLGAAEQVDSVVVYWLDGQVTKRTDIAAQQEITVAYEDATERRGISLPLPAGAGRFQPLNAGAGVDFQHAIHEYDDFLHTRTLHHDQSRNGPALATGDVNRDGLEDFFVGGNAGQAGAFFLQGRDGRFHRQDLLYDAVCQDAAAALFDADGDGDLDLYVVSGGTQWPAGADEYQDRLYINDGSGRFAKATAALPKLTSSGSCVQPADYDGDGDLDLFVGGRIVPGRYPLPAESYLLRNDGGRFTDVTPEELKTVGLVTGGAWTDLNADNAPDLAVVGEWMPVTFFRNTNGRLVRTDMVIHDDRGQQLKHTEGWYFHVNAADLDQDGDQDLLLGNLGLNSRLTASQRYPVQVYAKDFDENGALDPLLTVYFDDKKHLLHERDLLLKQLPGMKRRFPDYGSYARAGFDDALTPQDLEQAYVGSAHLLSSYLLENTGDGNFTMKPLPAECQFSPIFASLLLDMDGDGRHDILTAGNLYGTETTQIGRYDASFGNVLLNRGGMQLQPANPSATGPLLDGEVRSLAQLALADGRRLVLIGNYGAAVQALVWEPEGSTVPASSYITQK